MWMTNITTITTKTTNTTFTQKHFKYKEVQTQETLTSYFNVVADVTSIPITFGSIKAAQWISMMNDASYKVAF